MDDKNNSLTAPQTTDVTSNWAEPRFYVVGSKKFAALLFSTLGVYAMYWFFKNWRMYKAQTNEKMIPAMRGLFPIFFAHSLFDKVSKNIATQNKTYDWAPSSLATQFVILAIGTNFISKLTDDSFFSLIIVLLMSYSVYFPLSKAQKAINYACDQPLGESNSKLTDVNMIWMLLGVALTIFALLVGYAEWAGLLEG
jgi:hypothetical protein